MKILDFMLDHSYFILYLSSFILYTSYFHARRHGRLVEAMADKPGMVSDLAA
jgi:hypothetical protein